VTRRRRKHLADQAGQSTVEVVVAIPLLLAVAFAAFAVLAAGSARETAAAAAQAGAMAMLQDADPEAAAKDVLRAADTGPATVTVDGREVQVTVRPRHLGPAGTLLDATSTAQAGQGVPAAERTTTTVRGGDGKGSR
jgi:Flp pilus assembly protein TadG